MSNELTFSTTRLGLLLDQYDTEYGMLVDRLQGLTDAEYFWEPTPNSWRVCRREAAKTSQVVGKGDWVCEVEPGDPQPAPMATLAWRLCHIVTGQRLRWDYTFGTKTLTADDIEYPDSAVAALVFLDQSHQAWRAGLAGLADADLDVVGLSSYPDGLDPHVPFGPLLWWTNRDLIHHAGEIGLLRDLWHWQQR